MNRIIVFLLLLYCTFPFTKVSANNELDSLLTVVKQSRAGSTTYFKTLIHILDKYDQTKVAVNLDSLTDVFIANAFAVDSLYYYVKGLNLRAENFTNQKQYDEALKWRQKALEISQNEGFHRLEAYNLMKIALIKAFASDKYDSGFTEMEKSILICKEYQLEALLAKDYFIMSYFYGAIYQQKAYTPEIQQQEKYQNYLKQSVEYIDKAIILATKQNDTDEIQRMGGQRINLLLDLKAYQKAIDQANKILDEKRKKPLTYLGIQNEYIVIAKGYHGLNKLDLARTYLDSAKQIVTEAKLINDLIYITDIEMRWAMVREDYKEAFNLVISKEALKDSLWSADRKLAFNELSIKFETVQKEKENILLASEKQILLSRNNLMACFSAFALLVLGVLVFFFLKNRKQLILINEQKEKLEIGIEQKNRFFANVTHEFRTPLTLIVGPLKQLLKNDQLDKGTLAKLDTMTKSSEQLLNLVDEITDLDKYERGQLILRKESIHLLEHLNNWVAQFQEVATNRKIKFDLKYHLSPSLNVHIDIEKLRKIVFNLLSNAFKFSQSNDSITLDVSEHGQNLRISVSDTGLGIAAEELPHVFDRFYQSKNATNGGLGIGLHYCKNLIGLMNGTIAVSSREGEGSTFTLELPKVVVDNNRIQILSSAQTVNPSTDLAELVPAKYPGRTILIVEDNFQMQGYINEMLSPIGQTVISNNGKEALDVVRNQKIDLIITDLMMPEMDGYTMLDILKRDPKYQSIPAIVLTAKTAEKDKLKAITLGVDDYLTKPFLEEELLACVENILVNQKEKELEVSPEEINLGSSLPQLESANLKWLKNLEEIAFQKVTEPNFSISQLAQEVSVGERQLNRKLKSLTGLTPGNYIKEVKLQKARQLLENQCYNTVAEISYKVGFNTPDYFSNIYKKRFGKSPSEYLKSKV